MPTTAADALRKVHDQCVPVLLVNCIVSEPDCVAAIVGVGGVAVATPGAARAATAATVAARQAARP